MLLAHNHLIQISKIHNWLIKLSIQMKLFPLKEKFYQILIGISLNKFYLQLPGLQSISMELIQNSLLNAQEQILRNINIILKRKIPIMVLMMLEMFKILFCKLKPKKVLSKDHLLNLRLNVLTALRIMISQVFTQKEKVISLVLLVLNVVRHYQNNM